MRRHEKGAGCTDERVVQRSSGSTCAFAKMVSGAIADREPEYRNLGALEQAPSAFLLSDTSLWDWMRLRGCKHLQADHELSKKINLQ